MVRECTPENLSTGASFVSVQDAIDAASPGDTIEADAGAFEAACALDIDFLGKPIHLASVGSITRRGDTTITLADNASLAAATGLPTEIAGALAVPAAAQAQIGGDPITLSGPLSLGAGAVLLADGSLHIEGNGGFADRRTISSVPNHPVSVFAIDLEADGDVDVLSASFFDNTIAWYENDGAPTPSFVRRVVTNQLTFASTVYAADVDADGHTDIVAASQSNADVFWYKNDGASPPAFTPSLITSAGDLVLALHVADLDGDGDNDIVVANYIQNTIAWLDNDGASPPGFIRRIITAGIERPEDVTVADLDSDGDLDVLSGATSGAGGIFWYENDGASSPSFASHTVQANDRAYAFASADVDGDGDTDVLSGGSSTESVLWHRNDGGTPLVFTRIVIATSDEINSVYGLSAADVDNDGDPDVLATSALLGSVYWFENGGGPTPSFTRSVVDTQADGAWAVTSADLDNDGDREIISAARYDNRIDWYENLFVSSLNLSDSSIESFDTLTIRNKRLVLGPQAEVIAAGPATMDRASALQAPRRQRAGSPGGRRWPTNDPRRRERRFRNTPPTGTRSSQGSEATQRRNASH